MTTKYVSNARGSDSTGTGSATNPWKTMGKAIGATPAFTLDTANPNFLYVEPGIYRETLGSIGIAPTASGPLTIIGDTDGAGFLAGGYSTPATGLVDWRAWSNDSTAIGGSVIFASSVSYVTLSKLKITASTSSYLFYLIGTSTNWLIQDCILTAPNNHAVQLAGSTIGAWNITIDRCFIDAYGYGVNITVPYNATEYNTAILIQNCLLFGASTRGVNVAVSGSVLASAGSGITIQNCMAAWGFGFVLTDYGSATITNPVGVYNSYSLMNSYGVKAAHTGEIVEDGNAFIGAGTARSNVSSGTHSVAGVCPALDFMDHFLTGMPMRPFLTPLFTGPFGGFGGYGSPPTVDMMGRPRPEGFASTSISCGPLERHDTSVSNVTYADTGSPACLALVGPGSQDEPILVDASARTLSVKVRWDGNHGDTNKPQALLLAEPSIGVAAQTLTATSTGGTGSTPNSYETLTFSGFTPTAAGVVIIRYISRAAAGNGTAYFDTLTLT